MIWILGATGRTGREIAREVAARGGTPVLVGRNAERLRKTAADLGLGDAEVVATADPAAAIAADRPAPVRVRVDALPSVAITAGQLGEALAQSIVSGLTTGGRRYQGGLLVPARLAAEPRTHALPDGQTAKSAGGPTGELLAAH